MYILLDSTKYNTTLLTNKQFYLFLQLYPYSTVGSTEGYTAYVIKIFRFIMMTSAHRRRR